MNEVRKMNKKFTKVVALVIVVALVAAPIISFVTAIL